MQNPESGFAIYFDDQFTAGPYPWYEASSGKLPKVLTLLPGVHIIKCYCYELGIGVLSKSKPYRYSTHISVTIPEKKFITLKISSNGRQFLHEVD